MRLPHSRAPKTRIAAGRERCAASAVSIMDFDADVGQMHVDRRSKRVLLAKVDD
jgi:hypothetical protein